MLDWIMRTKTGAWAIALLAAAGLLAVGFGLASDYYQGELQRWQDKAALAQGRANRLAAQLEEKDKHPSQALGRFKDQAESFSSEPRAEEVQLQLGRAAVVLDGRVVLTLEKIDTPAQKARVRVRVLGGREGVAVMGPGSNVSFRLGGTLFHLVLKQTQSSSATVILIPK
jgi:hypothetical protein